MSDEATTDLIDELMDCSRKPDTTPEDVVLIGRLLALLRADELMELARHVGRAHSWESWES